VVVWDVTTGKERCRPPVEGGWAICDLAFAPDGKTLAAAESDRVILWDARSGKRIAQLDRTGRAVSFDGSGEKFITGETLCVWDAKTRKTIRTLNPRDSDSSLPADRAVISRDGKRVVSSHCLLIRVWDVATGKELLPRKGRREALDAVAWNPDGRRVVTGGGDGTYCLWDAKTGKPDRIFSHDPRDPHRRAGDLSMLAFSPDGRALLLPGKFLPLSSEASVDLPTGRCGAYARNGRRLAVSRGAGFRDPRRQEPDLAYAASRRRAIRPHPVAGVFAGQSHRRRRLRQARGPGR
jgi:WD40 repeat protein